MVRVVKEYDERYAEFLQVAQALFYSKGYEQTSVRQIINAVGVAKGTFYHYFDSKVDLLEALVESVVDSLYAEAFAAVEPVLADETLGAAEKIQRFFAHATNWKADNRDFVLESVRVFYRDDNVLLRTKMEQAAIARIAPLMSRIIRQGVAEGTFDVAYPDEAAQLMFRLNQDFSEAVAGLLLNGRRDEAALARLQRKQITYERSLERVLGAPPGSLQLLDPDLLQTWFPESNK